MIVIKNENDNKFKNIIHTKLRKNNIEKCKWLKDNVSWDINVSSIENSNFLVFDDNLLVGGAIGFIEYNWYFLDLLYVDEKYRKRNIGTNLIKEIEKLAKEIHLTGIRMETWNFQARGF